MGELVELGWNLVVPPFSVGEIADAVRSRLESFKGVEENPYGEGYSAVKIASHLINTGK